MFDSDGAQCVTLLQLKPTHGEQGTRCFLAIPDTVVFCSQAAYIHDVTLTMAKIPHSLICCAMCSAEVSVPRGPTHISQFGVLRNTF